MTCLSGDDLRRAFCGGHAQLRLHAGLLDDLNVFPVPDGDTGVNLVYTLEAGVHALAALADPTPATVARVLVEEVGSNSRGNSGFLLSRFCVGFGETVRDRAEVDGPTLRLAFQCGAWLARTALFEPVEGTILTVLDAVDQALGSAGDADGDPGRLLVRARDVSLAAVHDTPRLLPVLARAGVVDAGALGFHLLLDGMVRGLEGRDPASIDPTPFRFPPSEATPAAPPPLRYRYCTEATVDRPTGASWDDVRDDVRAFLSAAGDSVALVAEGQRMRLHVHTDDPEAVLARCAALGVLVSRKVDDMQGQVLAAAARDTSDPPPRVLAVIPGPGFRAIFAGFGVTDCFQHGALLPSAADLRRAVDALPPGPVILLPNHKNIIPAALQVRDQLGGSRLVAVLPTRDVVEGVAALYGFSEAEDLSTNLRSMAASRTQARCLEVYRATRASGWGNRHIREGQPFVVHAGDVLSVADDLVGAVREAVATLLRPDPRDEDDRPAPSLLTLYRGRRLDLQEAEAVEAALRADWSDLGIEVHDGGQGRALLLIAVE